MALRFFAIVIIRIYHVFVPEHGFSDTVTPSIYEREDVRQQDHFRSVPAVVVELIGIPATKLAAIIEGQLMGKGGEDL